MAADGRQDRRDLRNPRAPQDPRQARHRHRPHRVLQSKLLQMDDSFGSKSAVPSTTEHSRSTFNCGRTVTLPSRPEWQSPRTRNWRLWIGAQQRPPSKTALCRGCCLEIPERRRNMRPNAQLFRKRRAHDHQVMARPLCKQRSCSSANSNTAPLAPLPQG